MKKHKLQTINNKRNLAYSIDARYSGLYVWFGSFIFRLGGVTADDSYQYVLGRSWGLCIIITWRFCFCFPSIKPFKKLES